MLRVLHITNAYPYEEVPEYGVFIKEQIDSLDRSGFVRNEILFMNGRRDGKRAYLDGVREIRSRAKEVNVLHCHHLYSGFIAAAAMTGKPSVVSFLNDWLYEMDGVSLPILREVGCNFGAWWADRIILKSPVPKKFEGNSKFIYLPNGANSDQFKIVDRNEARSALGLSSTAIYLLFVSSKDLGRRQKRYDRFKAVLERVRLENPDRDIQELLLVNKPRELVLSYFGAADIHLMTSDYEGSPNSVKEALCCGLPVVTTPVGNVGDLLSEAPHCRVASSFDVDQLAALVGEVLAENIDREAIRSSFTRKDFSQEATARRLVQLYTEIASAK